MSLERRLVTRTKLQQPTVRIGGVELVTPFNLDFRADVWVPALYKRKFVRVAIAEKRWAELVEALGAPLKINQRHALNGAVSIFLSSITYRLPHPDGYLSQLSSELGKATASIAQFLGAAIPTPVKFRESQIVSARDHIAQILRNGWLNELKHTAGIYWGLLDLIDELHRAKQSRKGSHGHYELDALYSNIVRIVRAAGGNLRINSHDDRYGKGIVYTPLVKFTGTLFKILSEDISQLLPNEVQTGEARALAIGRLRKLLKKSHGNLIPPLEKARKYLEGSARASKRPRS